MGFPLEFRHEVVTPCSLTDHACALVQVADIDRLGERRDLADPLLVAVVRKRGRPETISRDARGEIERGIRNGHARSRRLVAHGVVADEISGHGGQDVRAERVIGEYPDVGLVLSKLLRTCPVVAPSASIFGSPSSALTPELRLPDQITGSVSALIPQGGTPDQMERLPQLQHRLALSTLRRRHSIVHSTSPMTQWLPISI